MTVACYRRSCFSHCCGSVQVAPEHAMRVFPSTAAETASEEEWTPPPDPQTEYEFSKFWRLGVPDRRLPPPCKWKKKRRRRRHHHNSGKVQSHDVTCSRWRLSTCLTAYFLIFAELDLPTSMLLAVSVVLSQVSCVPCVAALTSGSSHMLTRRYGACRHRNRPH